MSCSENPVHTAWPLFAGENLSSFSAFWCLSNLCKQIYSKLHMSIRTIQDLEHGISNPKAETILLIARELDISIDAILFPNIVRGHISKTAMDFFAGKSEAEVQKYVSLCQQADKLKTDK